MPDDSPYLRSSTSGDALLRSVSRATTAATSILDPAIIPAQAADALVRFLAARRVDFWRISGRRPHHIAHAGDGGLAPTTLPASLMRIARGGLSQMLTSDQLGNGSGAEWQRMLFSLDAHNIGVYSLAVGDRVLGAITVVGTDGYSEQHHEAVSLFSQQMAAALEKAELHQSAQDAALTMRLQNRVLSELTDERDVPSLRAGIEQLVSELLDDARIAVLPEDSLGRLTIPLLDAPRDGTLRIATEPEVAFIGPTLDEEQPIRLGKASYRILASLGMGNLAGSANATATIWGIRLQSGERTTGVLLLGITCDDPEDAGVQQVVTLLRTIAPAVSIALENAQLFAREHVRASRLQAANTLARTITSCTNRDDLFAALTSGIGVLFGFDRTSVYDADLSEWASTDMSSPRRSVARERSLVSTALHRRCASRIERHDRTCHAIPLESGERIHYVLYVEQHDVVTPEQESDDLALLSSICDHATACVVALKATERIERNYKDTIQALVHALEARDKYTADHSDAVAEWALETGRRLGMDEGQLRDLELGAILHDIGKVAIPDEILNKPGRLTDDEFEIMKSHTIVGERILKPIGFLKNVAPIVRHEHERWDGRGYPDGISGTDIPLASRIIFVCDAYHAMTSDRPYRPAQTHDFAQRIISENAGTQFDPAVVSVFIEVIDAWREHHGISLSGNLDGIEITNGLGASDASGADDTAAAA